MALTFGQEHPRPARASALAGLVRVQAVGGYGAPPRRLAPAADRDVLALHATLTGVGQARLLGRPRLELGTAGRLDHLPRRVVHAGWADQVGRAALEPVQRRAGEDLLLGRGALGPAAADEAHEPVQQRRDAVLEAGDVHQVHRKPHEPGDEAGQPDLADHGHRPEPGDRGHAALVEVPERTLRRLALDAAVDLLRGILR